MATVHFSTDRQKTTLEQGWQNVFFYPIITLFLVVSGCSVKYADNLADKGFDKECINHDKQAMRIYNRAILFNKKSAIAYWRRGNLYSKESFKYNYLKAISDLSKSIAIDSLFDGGYAYWDRAYCMQQVGDTIGALKDYDKAIAISPEKENFYFFRGTLKYYKLHDIEGALKDFDNAIKYWDGYDLARQCRAELKIELQDYEGAKIDYDKLQYSLKEADYNADVFYFRGVAKFETGDKIGACNDWIISNKLGYKLAKDKMDTLCK